MTDPTTGHDPPDRKWNWPRRPYGLPALFLVVGAGYAAGSQLAILLIEFTELQAVFFIPAGLTIAVLLRIRVRLWWVALLGAASAELILDLAAGFTPAESASFVAANVAEPLVGALIVHRAVHDIDLARLRHVWWFVLGGVLIGPALGAAIGGFADHMLSGDDMLTTFWQWWLGDALGVILVGSAILARRSSPDRRLLSTPAGVALVVGTGLLTLGVNLTPLPLTFLILISIVVAGSLFGVRAVAILGLLVAFIIAVDLTYDPSQLLAGLTETQALAMIKLELAIFGIAGLIVAAEAYERDLATSAAMVATARAQVSEAEHRMEHRIAVRLQEALLPAEPITHPDVSIAARYKAGSEALLVGGDWYDLFPLSEGRIGLTVGDVVGHGLEATASMGRLRTAVAALAPHTESPAELLGSLDRFAQAYGRNRYATALYAIFNPGNGGLRYASAGHPPLLVVEPGGGTRWLEGGRSAPLSDVIPEQRTEAVALLQPGCLVVGYTDGLVERRGESLEVGLERLQDAVVGNRDRGVEVICDRLIEYMGVGTQRADDVVVVVLRYEPSAVSVARSA